MAEVHDFEALRAARNQATQKMIYEMVERMGGDPSKAVSTFDPSACYCACPTGPCEHNWQGWREFECGSETVCSRCGMGAMSHSMRVGP